MNIFGNTEKEKEIPVEEEKNPEPVENKDAEITPAKEPVEFESFFVVQEERNSKLDLGKVMKYLEKELIDDSVIDEKFTVFELGSEQITLKKGVRTAAHIYPNSIQVFDRNFICAFFKNPSIRDLFKYAYENRILNLFGLTQAFIDEQFKWEMLELSKDTTDSNEMNNDTDDKNSSDAINSNIDVRNESKGENAA